jgi:hypothetical protein
MVLEANMAWLKWIGLIIAVIVLSLSVSAQARAAGSGFGISNYEMLPTNENGSLDTQAGSHPFALTTNIELNKEPGGVGPAALVKDLRFMLPPGLVGNVNAVPQCTETQFKTYIGGFANLCPEDTAIGTTFVTVTFNGSLLTFERPVFNLAPSLGEPARFAFEIFGSTIYLDTSLRTGGDYGVTVDVNNISQVLGFVSDKLTFWGVPGDPRHDSQRGWSCLLGPSVEAGPCVPQEDQSPVAFLTLPTSCAAPFSTSVSADPWEEPGVFTEPTGYVLHETGGPSLSLAGCNRLPFSPSVKVTPDGQAGSSPSGLTIDEHVPQETTLFPSGLGESAIKGLSVVLPEGLGLNPSAADGLQACSLAQIGLESGEASSCPEASKVATVRIKTPLLPNALEGAAYLGAQDANPFGSLVALYIDAYDPVSGLRGKAAGEVLEDPVTGQLSAHFEADPVLQDDPRFAREPEADYLPEVPLEDVELHFFGGDRAPFATPGLCGTYTTRGTFRPWSGNSQTESSTNFDIVSGPNGSACANPLPFNPSLTAGTTSIQAGGFTPFTMTVSRGDGQQSIRAFQLHMPRGLSGLLNGVKLCGEAEADAGACGPESLIGETTVSVGVGGDPYSVTGGKVYITGPYDGAPFGVSVVVRAKAGPYDLGNVIVRGTIAVDPITAALTVTVDGSGPYKIPTILDGIPLQIRHINFTTTRPGFTFNPTDCDAMSVTGSMSSTEGATAGLSVPFQVTNCAVLGFKPGFKVSTSGSTSRARGASLSVKLTYPKAAFGSQANIRSVKVDLPKQLPSRLTTLQKACAASQFQANPAGCPAASVVGHATAITPLIPVPLTGPAYFVSYGGAKFPELVIVLQGYGVTLNLHGETFISKAGITSSTFHTIPDAPVGSFELTLPQGPFSALAANGNLCKGKLLMPTAFVAQNGATIKQNTPIGVTGCTKKAKAKKKADKRHKKGK